MRRLPSLKPECSGTSDNKIHVSVHFNGGNSQNKLNLCGQIEFVTPGTTLVGCGADGAFHQSVLSSAWGRLQLLRGKPLSDGLNGDVH